MPRFNQKRWNPGKDSTPGYRTVDPTAIVLNIAREGDRAGCPCGCGEWPKGRRAEFAMGHDARLRGKLIRAHLTGTDIVEIFNGDPETASRHHAMAIAVRHDWERYLDAAVLRREGKNREVLQRALGSKRLVKVGRWEFTGQVAAVYRTEGEDFFEVEYVTKSGGVKRVRVPATDAPLVNS